VALGSDGRLRTWGWNAFGQLGDGSTESRDVPLVVGGLGAVSSFSVGYGHTLALGTR
jgi:alpha-tubulin suppressor-like RCC1 family protein